MGELVLGARAFTTVMNKNRSDWKKKHDYRSINKQHTENIRNYVKNSKQGKIIVSHKSTIVEILQGHKEDDLITALYNNFQDFS